MTAGGKLPKLALPSVAFPATLVLFAAVFHTQVCSLHGELLALVTLAHDFSP